MMRIERKMAGKRLEFVVNKYTTEDGKKGMFFDTHENIGLEDIDETTLSDGSTTRTYSSIPPKTEPTQTEIELDIYRKFRRIWDGNYAPEDGKIFLSDNPEKQTPDNTRVHDALDLLVRHLDPRLVILKFNKTGEMPSVESFIQKIKDPNGPYRSLTKEENDQLVDFQQQNTAHNLSMVPDEGIKYPSQKLFGDIEGEGIAFHLDIKRFGRVATVYLGGIPKLTNDKLFAKEVWADETDTMFGFIRDNEAIAARKSEKRLAEIDMEKNTPKKGELGFEAYELVEKGEEKGSKPQEKVEIDSLGRGFQIGSFYDRNSKVIQMKYDSLVGKEGAGPTPDGMTFNFSFSMEMPEKIYGESPLVLAISEFSAKLTMAVMNGTFKEYLMGIKKKYPRYDVDMKGYNTEEYRKAAIMNALYVLSPKFMKEGNTHLDEELRYMYPYLRNEKSIDRISTFFAATLSPDGKGLFNGLSGAEKNIGNLIIEIAKKMDSRAESHFIGGKIDVMTIITNITEACRHYANYVLESDLEDSHDKDAAMAHKAYEGVVYLLKAGYGEYAPLVAKVVLSDENYKFFMDKYNVWLQKKLAGQEMSRSGFKPSGIKPKNGIEVDSFEERVRPGAVRGGDPEVNEGYTPGPTGGKGPIKFGGK